MTIRRSVGPRRPEGGCRGDRVATPVGPGCGRPAWSCASPVMAARSLSTSWTSRDDAPSGTRPRCSTELRTARAEIDECGEELLRRRRRGLVHIGSWTSELLPPFVDCETGARAQAPRCLLHSDLNRASLFLHWYTTNGSVAGPLMTVPLASSNQPTFTSQPLMRSSKRWRTRPRPWTSWGKRKNEIAAVPQAPCLASAKAF